MKQHYAITSFLFATIFLISCQTAEEILETRYVNGTVVQDSIDFFNTTVPLESGEWEIAATYVKSDQISSMQQVFLTQQESGEIKKAVIVTRNNLPTNYYWRKDPLCLHVQKGDLPGKVYTLREQGFQDCFAIFLDSSDNADFPLFDKAQDFFAENSYDFPTDTSVVFFHISRNGRLYKAIYLFENEEREEQTNEIYEWALEHHDAVLNGFL